MTYPHAQLWLVAVIVGLGYIIAHLPGALAPKWFSPLLKQFPRNYFLGAALVVLAGIWFTWLTATTDLGELTPYRERLIMMWVIGTTLMVIFMPTFIAVRGLAMLLLLGSMLLLESSDLSNTPWRLVITVLAYVWVTGSVFLIASPYILRDIIVFATASEKRMRALCWPGVVFGVVLLGLAASVYR